MFYTAMLLFNIIIPIIVTIGGILMMKRPPQKINSIIGYRTARSMKNAETWAFAHKLCGKIWTVTGPVMLALTLAVFLPFMKSGDDTLGNVSLITELVQVIILILTVIPVEKGLKKNFDDNGERK